MCEPHHKISNLGRGGDENHVPLPYYTLILTGFKWCVSTGRFSTHTYNDVLTAIKNVALAYSVDTTELHHFSHVRKTDGFSLDIYIYPHFSAFISQTLSNYLQSTKAHDCNASE